MVKPTSAYISLKKNSDELFQFEFRQILYDPQLHWGAKCLALALHDLPGNGYFEPSAMARKLRTDRVCITRWLKELKRRKFDFTSKKRKRGGGLGVPASF